MQQIPELKPGEPAKLAVGQIAELQRTFTQQDVERFADVSLDRNPVHLTKDHGDKRFPGQIAHGMLTASMFSALFGTRLPGAIYLSQTLNFRAPVLLGDTVTARITVKALRKKLVTCETACRNQRGVVVVDGEALVSLPTLVTSDWTANAAAAKAKAEADLIPDRSCFN